MKWPLGPALAKPVIAGSSAFNFPRKMEGVLLE